jgi:ATP-dependent DNA ligase
VFSRNDWSDRYAGIVRAAANLPCRSAIIDGEAIVQNGHGASDFDALQSALRRQPHSIILYAFDLVERLTTAWSAFESSRMNDVNGATRSLGWR